MELQVSRNSLSDKKGKAFAPIIQSYVLSVSSHVFDPKYRHKSSEIQEVAW